MFNQCSLLLLNYARPECLECILDTNLALPWNEIVVMDSSMLSGDTISLRIRADSRLKLIGVNEDVKQYTRACGSIICKNNLVCTQDDDCLVKEKGWERLFKAWDGRSIVRLVPEWREAASSIKLGYGSMFDNRWLQASWALYMAMQPVIVEKASKEAADEAWTTFWGMQIPITAQHKHVTFLLDRDYMRAETNKRSMSLSKDVLMDRAGVRGCARAMRNSFCSSRCQGESECHTALQTLVKESFG